VLADEGGDPVEFRTPETAALVEAHRVEPELCSILVALHVDVRRLGPVTGEEEPVGATVGMPNDATAAGVTAMGDLSAAGASRARRCRKRRCVAA